MSHTSSPSENRAMSPWPTFVVTAIAAYISTLDLSIVNVAFAEIATRAFRLEDHIARMGEDNFILLITGDSEVAEQIAARIASQWTLEGIPAISLHYAWVSHQAGESALEFLNRLDGDSLKTSSF